MAGLRLLQLPGGPTQHVEGLGEQTGALQVEEGVESGQDLAVVSVQRLQPVVDLALDVRDAPLRLHVFPALPVAALGELPLLVQFLQPGGDLGKPGRLGLESVQLFFRGGELREVLLGLVAAVLRPTQVGFGPAQVGRKARVLAVGGLQLRADLAGRFQFFFGSGVLFADPLELALQALALLAGVLQLGLEGVEVGFGEASFQDPCLGAEVVAVLAQKGLGRLHVAYAEETGDLAHPAYALVLGEEP